ncbi:MAG: 5-formyltetrahydrofolate cyclo-ligase [Candidatus Entotheonellia bacterium]
MPVPKQTLREEIWQALTSHKVARFPGTRGRIPNFVGAEAAAQHLTTFAAWQAARTLKCNPDSPQRPVRYAALRAGKVVYLAVPRLRELKPFIALDPAALDPTTLWQASSIQGAFALGKPVSLDEMAPIDLIVAGTVAVARDGARLGKGGGYSDLEYALCRQAGLVTEETPIVTTVHSLQVVAEGTIEMTAHDISLNGFATPEGLIPTERRYPRPTGILWDELGEKIDEIPVLRQPSIRRPLPPVTGHPT